MKRVQVFVRLKAGVLDVQGKAVETGLHDIGVKNISNVRVGKLIEFEVPGGSSDKTEIEKICKELLANTVIEDFEIKELA